MRTAYNPPNRAVKERIDEFLCLVDKRERAILQEVNKDLMSDPQEAINTTFDVKLTDGHTYRTEIVGFDNPSKQFRLDPGTWDNWPNNCYNSVTNLNDIGIADTLNTVPNIFALRFNPLHSVDNIGKLYTSRGRLVKVINLDKLVQDVQRGFVNSCPHNGSVARRYISALRRESNANRYGIT